MEEAQGPKHAERETGEESAEIRTLKDISHDENDAGIPSDKIVVLDESFDSD